GLRACRQFDERTLLGSVRFSRAGPRCVWRGESPLLVVLVIRAKSRNLLMAESRDFSAENEPSLYRHRRTRSRPAHCNYLTAGPAQRICWEQHSRKDRVA